MARSAWGYSNYDCFWTSWLLLPIGEQGKNTLPGTPELDSWSQSKQEASFPPSFPTSSFIPWLPNPHEGELGESLVFNTAMAGSGSGYHIPFLTSPAPPSNTTTQFSQGPGRGGRKQDIPPGGHPLSLTRVIAWTLSPSPRWRPHQGRGLILEP